jgi:GMP synthase (glutamine-hydrolysing)
MRQFLIIKVGSTLPSLLSKKGDFEDWIVSGMGTAANQTTTIDVRAGTPLPDYDQVSGIVISGSHAMVTDHYDWSERTARWLPGAVERNIPLLGICYGHQLLAYAFGGSVGNNPNGREFGTVQVDLDEHAKSDPLLGAFSTPIKVHVSHIQSVLSLPAGAKHLASSALDANQAFVIGKAAWGVQFHPEFDAEVVIEYINSRRQALRHEGQDPDCLVETCADTPFGSAILRRFVQIVKDAGRGL